MSIALTGRRLAAAHWPLLAVCALFLVAGAHISDDYGVIPDEREQRRIGNAALDYLAGDGERAFDQLLFAHDRYYGAMLEAPLILIERVLAPDDRQAVTLRRLLTHLVFLGGGVCCYLLVHRLFASRALALIATVLFLLHPRIYAHSFLNSKDVPFLAMFMVSLYLTHRAFRRNTLAAFVLCGVGAGVLINLRIMGIILFAAVLILRALDLPLATSREERARILLTASAFALTAALVFLASLPALWTDPLDRFAEMLRALTVHPRQTFSLFRGEWFYSPNGPPFDYVPVWIGITTPPATLLLALVGAVALAGRGLRRPRSILRNGPLRFGFLLLAVPAGTMVAVVVLESNAYDGWRHLYFLYAPLLLLAVFGLQWGASFIRGQWAHAGIYSLTGVAVAVAIVSLSRIHPYQNSYFNLLTDRTTPERLSSTYHMNYGQNTWGLEFVSAITGMVEAHPSGALYVAIPYALRNGRLLPPGDSERLVATQEFRSGERNFYALRDGQPCPVPPPDGARVSHLYANTISCVVDPVAWFGGLRQRAPETMPLSRFRFNAHRVGDVLVYLRDGCSPDDTGERIFLHVHPLDPADLPSSLPKSRYEQMYGFENRDFTFSRFGVRIDGDCIAVAPLPDYPIARIHTGQYSPAYAETVLRSLRDAEPLVRSRFDIHLDPDARTLTYVRHRCSAVDAASRFFLHLLPLDARDLPHQRRTHGFDNLNFSLHDHGARTDDGRCAAAVPIPRYPIASIHTGQFDDRERLWETTFAWPGGE